MKMKMVITAIVFALLVVQAQTLFAQQKYALVIGNGNYTHAGVLEKTLNDANDMAEVLTGLGFTVDKLLNGDLANMESAIMRLKNRLSVSNNSYGFLYYSGHGLQYSGVNYLIPVNANLASASSLRERALSADWVLEELNTTGNTLNIIVLDACRDNPFKGLRNINKGLAAPSNQYSDSIIVYATSAGSYAFENRNDRNGVFTTHLLNNLKTPGLEVAEIFRRTGRDVTDASRREQIPAVYNQFFGEAYFSKPVTQPPVGQQTTTQNAQFFYDRGGKFYWNSDYDTAIADYTEAIRLDPNYKEAYWSRGDAYASKRDYDRAIADYNQAIRLDPNFAKAYFSRGLAYSSKKDYDREIADYTQAIRFDPNNELYYSTRGDAYKEKKDYDRAIADFTKVIQINSNSPRGFGSRGNVYLEMKDYDRAIADYTQAIRNNPDYKYFYRHRGDAYFGKKDYNRAIADYENALKIDPNILFTKEKLEEAQKLRGR